jgi:two-component sensor histidine kinase
MTFTSVALENVFLNHPDAMVLVLNNKIAFVNKRADALGFITGKSPNFSGILYEEDWELFLNLLSDSTLYEAGKEMTFPVNGNYTHLFDYVQFTFFHSSQGNNLLLLVRRLCDKTTMNFTSYSNREIVLSNNNSYYVEEKTYFLRLNANYKVVSIDTHAEACIYEMTGKTNIVGDYFFQLFSFWINEYRKLALLKKFEEVRKGTVVIFEFEFTHRGRYQCLKTYIHPIVNSQERVEEYSFIAHDITHKKEFFKRIQEALKEKELLLKEVNHRVKNNLQMVSSMLNLQKNFSDDERLITLLEENKSRINSLSIIHDHLYRSQNFLTIDFSSYLHSLVTNLIATFSSFHGKIDLSTDMDTVDLSIDQAIPCGLIVNELLTNAVKYAFVNREEGQIKLSLKKLEHSIRIIISDNGTGLPGNIDIKNTETLGLQLVHMLITQLGGEIDVERKNGTSFIVTFDMIF